MNNRYTLDKYEKLAFTEMVKDFLDSDDDSYDLSDSGLNYSTLGDILEDLGYTKDEYDTNGWQMDVTIEYYKENHVRLAIRGTAYVFEIILHKED